MRFQKMETSTDLETATEMSWQELIDRRDCLYERLEKLYDETPVERIEGWGNKFEMGHKFASTLDWVAHYSPHPEAMESIASALESIVKWPTAGFTAREIRRFIKFSRAGGYDNVPDVVRLGQMVRKMGEDDPHNERGVHLDVDFLYWNSGWGVDGEASEEEQLSAHSHDVKRELEKIMCKAYPEQIEVLARTGRKEREEQAREQYIQDFFADAKQFYTHRSMFEHLRRDDLMQRPYHKMMVYPVALDEIAGGGWLNDVKDDANATVLSFYENKSHLIQERDNMDTKPWRDRFNRTFDEQFERRLQRTWEHKPWLIDFSLKYMDLFAKSFVAGNQGENHAGEVELFYRNPRYNSSDMRILDQEYEIRSLEPEEEKMFVESVREIERANINEIFVPNDNQVRRRLEGEPYRVTLTDGRCYTMFITPEVGSIHNEGAIKLLTQEGPDSLFNYKKGYISQDSE